MPTPMTEMEIKAIRNMLAAASRGAKINDLHQFVLTSSTNPDVVAVNDAFNFLVAQIAVVTPPKPEAAPATSAVAAAE